MNKRSMVGCTAGVLGAIILVTVMYIMKILGLGDPGFVGIYRSTFGANAPQDHFLAAILFMISGGIWGLLFTLLVKDPTVVKGMFFGILPTLWLWIVVNAFIGKPLFNNFTPKGLLLPILFNVIIWGSFIGWFTARRLRPIIY